MKAVIINNTVNTFEVLPKIYGSVINFDKADAETLESLGIFDVVQPEITDFEKFTTLIPSDFSTTDKVFYQRKEPLSLEEQIVKYKEIWNTDGEQYYNEIENRIIQLLIGREDSVSIMLEIKRTINPMLELIKQGKQSLALLDYMDGQNNPTIPEVIALFNEIGQYCQEYYQTKYPH